MQLLKLLSSDDLFDAEKRGGPSQWPAVGTSAGDDDDDDAPVVD